MPEDMVRIKTGVSLSFVSGTAREDVIEIPRSEWDAMTPEQREQRLESIAKEMLDNEVNAWAYVEDEG